MVQSEISGRTEVSLSKKEVGGFALLIGLVIPCLNRFFLGVKLHPVIG